MQTCSKSTIKTPEQRQWRRFVVFIGNFEHIQRVFIGVFIANFIPFSSVSILDFEQVNVCWVIYQSSKKFIGNYMAKNVADFKT